MKEAWWSIAYWKGPREWSYQMADTRLHAMRVAVSLLRRNKGARVRVYNGVGHLIWERGVARGGPKSGSR
ncbi:hypothetical protein [Microcystis phage Mwe-JY26]